MKTHLRRIATLLTYTLVFNIISFAFYFILAFSSHNFEGMIWFVFGMAQVFFTVLFFSKIPVSKISEEKGLKTDLAVYFAVLCALSIVAAILRLETGSWSSFIFFNTFHPLTLSSLLDFLSIYIGVYIIENAIKTYCLYKNMIHKSISKLWSIILTVIMVLLLLVFIVLLIIF